MSKDQYQQQDQKNIDTVLSSEANSLTKMRNDIVKLLEANKQLKDSIELKQQVDALKKEAPSLPWFKRFVQIIHQVKYLFIKNDEQIAAERREFNKEILTYVDNTLIKVGKKSSSLQVIIDKELQTGLDKIFKKLNNKSLFSEQLERAGKLQEHLSSLAVSQEDFRGIVEKAYNANEAVALMHERTQLTQIQQDITKLINANDKVQGLLTIKQELAKLRQELPSTWLDNLKKSVAKIKEAFVKNPEQILKDSIVKNEATLRYVDNALKTTGKIIESSKLARKNKLHKELEKLGKRGVSSDKLELLSSAIDSTFAKTVAISGPLFTMDQQQSQSQALHSSMPNLQTTSLPPSPHLANTSLPNLAVQQPNVAEAIPQAPPLPGKSAQQAAIHSIPRPTRPAPPPPPPLTHATSLPDIHAPKPEENVRRASTSSQEKKRQAPLPPTQATSLQNLATQQPNVASAVIPPAPPPPPLPSPHAVPGLQHGAHQVDTQIVPPPAAELNIPIPPPPLPVGGFNPPPPPPPPPAPSAEQPKNPVEGQENQELREGGTQSKTDIPNRGDLFAAIRAGIKLKDPSERVEKEKRIEKEEIKKDGGIGEVKPEAVGDIGSALRKAMEDRAKAFQSNDDDDDDDTHDHAEIMNLIKDDLVKFINNEKVDGFTLISKLHDEFPNAKDIKSKKELVEFVNADFGEWDKDDQVKEDKQNEIIDKLKNIKKQHDQGSINLSAKPVINVQKGEIPTNLVAEAQAITANITKTENVAGQSSKPPAPPIPPKARSPGSFAK
ncbi:MAG: hypothetical protein LN568_01705 [Rickettsia endosymbiont of Pseudomimeciton antennatum]|nr:hypothetical protein [Rickettsia endosymbiont of Pseudomimeciton antennatum]